MQKALILIGLGVVVIAGAACGSGSDSGAALGLDPWESPVIEATTILSQTLEPVPTGTPTTTPLPSSTMVVVLPPDPIRVKFQAADGQDLTGTYYPGSQNPAPVIVLMHWARGDQSDWEPIARWLQGRGLLERKPDYNNSWLSSDWYPERNLSLPLGVFAFNFRSCEGECQLYQPAEWLLDARAGLQAAADLEGTDPDRILAAGASLGADGAVDGCAWLNKSDRGTCQGAFALSPASLLTEPFDQAAQELLPDHPVYCLYGLRDDASVVTCQSVEGLKAVDYGYTEDHGMELLQPERKPNSLDLLEKFISEALDLTNE